MPIKKQLNILDYSLRSIWRKKVKSFGVLAVFSGVIFLLASFQLTSKGLSDFAVTRLTFAPDITLQKMTAGRQESIPMAHIKKLKTIFGIRQVVPRVWGYHFDETNGANYTVLALAPEKIDEMLESDAVLDYGGRPAPGSVLIGRGVKQAKTQLGQLKIFSLFRPDLSLKALTISGVFAEQTDLLTYDTIVMNLEDGRDLFAIDPALATDLCVTVANEREIPTIAKKIAAMFPDTRVVTRQQIQKTYQAVFGWRSGFGSVCLMTAVAAFIIFAWDKASGLSPEEKKEIAILKVIGWQTADVLTMRFWEGVVISLAAFLIGYTLGYLHVAYFSASLFRPVLMGWSVIFPALRLKPEPQLAELLLIFCMTVVPYMAATVIPAWRSAVIPPDSAMN